MVLGHKVEMRIAELIRENINILKLGIFLEGPARVMVQEFLKRNNDNGRLSQKIARINGMKKCYFWYNFI